MNTLSYKFFEDNGGCFELYIDNISLAEHIGCDEILIPHWIIDRGIPTFPPKESPKSVSERIVAVCCCGEYGCDHLRCQVKIEKDIVIFSHFKRPRYSGVIDKTFKFTKKNFQEIENQLAGDAEKIRKNFEN